VESPSRDLAGAVTDRIWPCVMLQWEWLGGLPPLRRAAIVGAGSWGTALAVVLARAGLEVELGCRTAGQADALSRARENPRYLPGVPLPDAVTVSRASDLRLGSQDLVCFAVPARALPAVVAAHGPDVPARASLLVLSKGLVAPLGTLPSAYVAERVPVRATACLGGPGHAAESLASGAALVVGSLDRAFARQLASVLAAAGLDVQTTPDVTGVELAGCAKNAAALAAAAAAPAGANVAGAAAGKVFAEVEAYARRHGALPETFAGLAGAGDLVATVMAHGSRNRRAGELLGSGVPAAEVEPALGQSAEAVDAIPLLAGALREDGMQAPVVDGLAELIAGRIGPERWSEGLVSPAGSRRPVRAA
jgi:glycerol-3-phosphate dehydrogenase